jgi:hypothetical protein
MQDDQIGDRHTLLVPLLELGILRVGSASRNRCRNALTERAGLSTLRHDTLTLSKLIGMVKSAVAVSSRRRSGWRGGCYSSVA